MEEGGYSYEMRKVRLLAVLAMDEITDIEGGSRISTMEVLLGKVGI